MSDYGYREPASWEKVGGKKFGPAIKHDGSREPPVAPGTPVSIWSWRFWVALTYPERHDWSKVRWYRFRYPNGNPDYQKTRNYQVHSEGEARDMIAAARTWLKLHNIKE